MIWRYHPETKVFEIFAEGGGNTFSLEIDGAGREFSGTNGGGTRGMHYVQGGYAEKNWGKHGPLTNPYAFGYYRHMRHEGVPGTVQPDVRRSTKEGRSPRSTTVWSSRPTRSTIASWPAA